MLKGVNQNIRPKVVRLAGVLLFALSWHMLSVLQNEPSIVGIDKIAIAAMSELSNGIIIDNALSTISILVRGIIIASVLGIAVAVIVCYKNCLYDLLMPTIEFCRNIPSITLFPILLVIYGIGDASRIFVIFWTVFPPVLLSSVQGIQNVDMGSIEAAMALGFSNCQIMRHIKIPLAAPSILNGIRIGAGSGFVAVVVAEMLGATKGLGYMVLWTTNSFKYPETYVYILLIGLLGALTNLWMEKVKSHYERKVS
jgi:ABC-type nitrate/sulfonate/bicarbonate transport system permease component